MAGIRKTAYLKWVRTSFFVRFHMVLILAGTFLAGVLASKALLLLRIDRMTIRYPIAVLFSYLAFFLFVRIWLWYVSASAPAAEDDAGSSDVLGILDIPGGSGSAPGDIIYFGGGKGGGGGAGGSFAAVADTAGRGTEAATEAVGANLAAGTGNGESGAGSAAGEAVAGLLDIDEVKIPLLLLGALVALVAGAAGFLIYEAPDILADAAFNAALAASLLRGARQSVASDWTEDVLRATWKPFLFILAVTFLFALVMNSLLPQAKTIRDILKLVG